MSADGTGSIGVPCRAARLRQRMSIARAVCGLRPGRAGDTAQRRRPLQKNAALDRGAGAGYGKPASCCSSAQKGLLAGLAARAAGGARSAIQTEQALAALGVTARAVEPLTPARHVFSHLVWEMDGFACAAQSCAPPPGCVWGRGSGRSVYTAGRVQGIPSGVEKYFVNRPESGYNKRAKIGVQEGADGTFSGVKPTRLALGAAQTALAAEPHCTGKNEKRVREALRPKRGRYHHEKSTLQPFLVLRCHCRRADCRLFCAAARPSWMNMSSSCSVRILRNLRRKKPPQRTRRMTPRMTSRFKRGRSAASETEKRRNGLRAVPAFQFVKNFRPTALRTEPHAPAGAAVTPFFRNTLSLMPRSTQRNASSACTHPAAYALSYSTKEWDKI